MYLWTKYYKKSSFFSYSLFLQFKQAFTYEEKDTYKLCTCKYYIQNINSTHFLCAVLHHLALQIAICSLCCTCTCTSKREICTLSKSKDCVWPSVTCIKALERNLRGILIVIHVLPVYKLSYHQFIVSFYFQAYRAKEPGPDKRSNLFTEEFNRKFFYRQG